MNLPKKQKIIIAILVSIACVIIGAILFVVLYEEKKQTKTGNRLVKINNPPIQPKSNASISSSQSRSFLTSATTFTNTKELVQD